MILGRFLSFMLYVKYNLPDMFQSLNVKGPDFIEIAA